MTSPRRYPWAPLERLVRDPKKVLLLDGRQIANYAAKGLTPNRADELAIRAGWLPVEVWPDWGSELADARRLRRNAQERARYRVSKAKRVRRQETERAYREECREYVLAAKRRYREENKAAIAERRKAYVEANRERKRDADRERYRRRRACVEPGSGSTAPSTAPHDLHEQGQKSALEVTGIPAGRVSA